MVCAKIGERFYKSSTYALTVLFLNFIATQMTNTTQA